MGEKGKIAECASPVRVGFVCVDARSWEFLEFALPVLESALGETLPGVRWRFETAKEGEKRTGAVPVLRHYEKAHDYLVRRGLDFSFVLTAGEVEVTDSRGSGLLASRSMSSATIPLKAVFGDDTPADVQFSRPDYSVLSERFTNLFLLLLGSLCGLDETGDTGAGLCPVSIRRMSWKAAGGTRTRSEAGCSRGSRTYPRRPDGGR